MPRATSHEIRGPRRRTSQLGVTMVHMLVYVTALAVVINLGATLFVAVLRMHDAGTAALDESLALRAIEYELRETVSEGMSLLPVLGEFATSESTAVLALPPDLQTGGARYAVLQRLAEDDGFVVRRLGFQESPEGLTLTYMKTYRPVFTALGFEYGGDVAAARSVGLRFSLKAEENPQRPPCEHHLRIALGGIGGAM